MNSSVMPLLSGPGTVEGVEGDEVAELLGPEAAEEVLHARALELEDAVRVPGLEDLEGPGVVERAGC